MVGSISGMLEASWEYLAAFWGCLGCLGSLLEGVGGVLGASWGVLGASWEPLGQVFGVLGASWGVLGASWEPLGEVFGVSGAPLGASWAHLGDFCRKDAKKVPEMIKIPFLGAHFGGRNRQKIDEKIVLIFNHFFNRFRADF